MRRLVVICVFLLIVISCSSAFAQQDGLRAAPPPPKVEAPSPTATAQELESRGDELRGLKAYTDAIDYYRAAIAKQKSAVLYNKLGIAELQLSRLKEAKKDFGRAIKMDKKYPDAYNNLGVIYYKEKNYGRAIKEYQKAILLQDAMASFHSNLGSAYFAKQNYQLAMMEYGRALQLDPDVFDHSSTSGVAAQLQPRDKAYFSYILARMYAQAGNLDKSFQCLQRAMEDGYDVKAKIGSDDTFANLRKDPRFEQLMVSNPVAIPQ